MKSKQGIYALFLARHIIKIANVAKPRPQYDEFFTQFGRRIREFRKAKNMTIADLADKSGLEISTIGRIERGVMNPSVRTVKHIAEALGVEVRELF